MDMDMDMDMDMEDATERGTTTPPRILWALYGFCLPSTTTDPLTRLQPFAQEAGTDPEQ